MKSSVVPRILRDITGVILVACCVVLILFFGVMPLLHFTACPVLKNKGGSVYQKGSLAFMRETDPAKLKKGDVVFYYNGDTPVGMEVVSNDTANSVITTDTGKTLAYRNVSGKGVFSVPNLGSYAHWLTHGKGLNASVIAMGVTFLIFAVSAFLVRYPDE